MRRPSNARNPFATTGSVKRARYRNGGVCGMKRRQLAFEHQQYRAWQCRNRGNQPRGPKPRGGEEP